MNGRAMSTLALLPWYALQTKARHEKAVCNYLRLQEVEQFLPLYKSRREWSDRVKVVEMPLFGGYIFCRLDTALVVSVLPGLHPIFNNFSRLPTGSLTVRFLARRIGLTYRAVASSFPFSRYPHVMSLNIDIS